MAQPAHGQPHDPAGTVFFEATLTVGVDEFNFFGYVTGQGSLSPTRGTLHGVEFQLSSITTDNSATLRLILEDFVVSDFILQLGNKQFLSTDANLTPLGSLSSYAWANPGLNWSNGRTVQVKMQLPSPVLSGVSVDSVTRAAAKVTVNVSDGEGETVYLQYGFRRLEPHAAADGPNGTAVFDLTGLEAGTRYGVRASLDGTLPYKDWLTTDRFETNRSLRYGPDYLVSAPTGNGGYELSWG